MMKRVSILVLATAAVLGLVLLSGCGGGDNGGGVQPTGLGSVSGTVWAGLTNPVTLGNVVLRLMTQPPVTNPPTPPVMVAQGVSDANGNFTITGVPPGTYTLEVIVDPGTGFVVPSWADPIVVTVLPDQNTQLPQNTIRLVDADDQPPQEP